MLDGNLVAHTLRLSEKELLWEKKRHELETVTDGCGKGIDTVIILQLLGIHTSQSCEGHLCWGLCAPWVDISVPKTLAVEEFELQRNIAFEKADQLEECGASDEIVEAAYDKAHALRREIKNILIQEPMKVLSYLELFYTDRSVPFERRIMLRIFGNGRFGRIQSQGADFQEILADDIRS